MKGLGAFHGNVALLALLAAATATPAANGAAIFLTYHPADGVDPLGVPFGARGEDPFAVRYSSLVADKGRFDFPYFVADGVLPIESIPNATAPFESTRQAYAAALASRQALEPPVTLGLRGAATESNAAAIVEVVPRSALAGERLRAWLAVVEDAVHYQGPPALTNGVTEHRFTVRALHDLGPLDLGNGSASRLDAGVPLDGAWVRDRLSVVAWLQADAPGTRFEAREVVQAVQARLQDLGAGADASGKTVLAEMYSATWCDPCLYGDLAFEAVAVAQGDAEPLQPTQGASYFAGPPSLVAAGAALAAGLVAFLAARRV